MKPDPTSMAEESAQPALATERLVIETSELWLPKIGERNKTLVISPGRAQSATELLRIRATESVQAWHLDLHDATMTAAACDESIDVLSGADLPEMEFDLVVMPILKRGEAELTRDLLQQSHQRLTTGGWFLASVDNPKDTWLHDQLKALFGKVTAHRAKTGCVYWCRKSTPLKKEKDFRCEFSFRDGGRNFQVITRPGVFSHRRLDPAAKQLMLSCDIGETDNVLEMGCGSGAVSLAAAACTSGTVFGVDSNARAVQCVQESAAKNELTNIETIWNADGEISLPVEVDLAFANPPYFSDEQIAQHFVDTSLRLLRTGGALLSVTKKPNWFEAYYDALGLDDILLFEAGHYVVACGRKPSIA